MTDQRNATFDAANHAMESARLARALWLLLNSVDTDFADERDLEAMRGVATQLMDELAPVVEKMHARAA